MQSIPPNTTPEPSRKVYSVAELNRAARAQLEAGFSLIWIEGEISNLARPRSGHIYFSLKDSFAQVRCAMFRMRASLLRFSPENGDQVLIRARVSLYETRGDFQLIVEQMEQSGAGALQQAYEALKARLSKEGLFDESRKKPLPLHIERIGVVTSPSGAAVRDIITVLRRRFPAIGIIVYPVSVQGDAAAGEIAAAIAKAGERKEVDVLIVGRGGGSLEDLWAFNEEVVARALAACPLPTVSAVGHEVDTAISDFVADQRAPTPSAAAEMLSPDGDKLRLQLQQLRLRQARSMQRLLNGYLRVAEQLQRRLKHPGRRIEESSQRCDELELRLGRSVQQQLAQRRLRLNHLQRTLDAHQPGIRIRAQTEHLGNLRQRLQRAEGQLIKERRHSFHTLLRTLDTVSPLATLSRGYAIVQRADSGEIIHDSRSVKLGERLRARVEHGELICQVEERIDEQ